MTLPGALRRRRLVVVDLRLRVGNARARAVNSAGRASLACDTMYYDHGAHVHGTPHYLNRIATSRKFQTAGQAATFAGVDGSAGSCEHNRAPMHKNNDHRRRWKAHRAIKHLGVQQFLGIIAERLVASGRAFWRAAGCWRTVGNLSVALRVFLRRELAICVIFFRFWLLNSHFLDVLLVFLRSWLQRCCRGSGLFILTRAFHRVVHVYWILQGYHPRGNCMCLGVQRGGMHNRLGAGSIVKRDGPVYTVDVAWVVAWLLCLMTPVACARAQRLWHTADLCPTRVATLSRVSRCVRNPQPTVTASRGLGKGTECCRDRDSTCQAPVSLELSVRFVFVRHDRDSRPQQFRVEQPT
jgi:hypothetical protein